jgi:hypothetical protein
MMNNEGTNGTADKDHDLVYTELQIQKKVVKKFNNNSSFRLLKNSAKNTGIDGGKYIYIYIYMYIYIWGDECLFMYISMYIIIFKKQCEEYSCWWW